MLDFGFQAKTDGLNVCGEGGEYESLVLDCPLFFARIVMCVSSFELFDDMLNWKLIEINFIFSDEFKLVGELDYAFTPSGHALIQSFHLEPKSGDFDSFPERTIQVQPESIVDLPTTHAVSSSHVDAVLSGSVVQSSHFTTLCVRATTSGSVGDAIHQALQWATAQLIEHSLNLNDVFYSHMLLPSMSDYLVANSAYSTFFNVRPPSRCSVQLASSDEIVLELLATRSARDVLHVQSHSSWAPANIGPYAQASTLSGIVFLAGQIGLQPSRMQLPVPKSEAPLAQLRAESAQCLANCSAVLVGTGSNLGRLLSAVQYVAAESYDAASALTLAHSLLASAVSTAARKRFAECNFRNDYFDDEGIAQQGPIVRPKNTVPNVPILSVCVPALPRSAAVEIQLSSWQHRIDRALVVTEVDPQCYALDSGAGFVQHQALLSWQIACSTVATLSYSDCVPSTAFAAALRSMQSHLDTADISLSTIVHMRIFFQSSPTLTAQDVEAHFAEAFGLLHPDLRVPAVTAIAVSAIHPSIGSAASSVASDSVAPQIAMHGLWLDLERLASQSWIAGVRHAERLG
jgi:enamine deaminase RidA (YjgF/YER057c/UK114 family)